MTQNWVQHTLAHRGWRPQNQIAVLLGLGVLIVLIFAGVYLSQVASYATTIREVEALLEERDRLEFTNEQLRADIAELQTVPRLLTRARELGFRPAEARDIDYIVVDGYNPNRSNTVLGLPVNDEYLDQPAYDETFSGWLQQQFDTLRQQFESFGR